MDARELLEALEEKSTEPMSQYRLFAEADPALLEQPEVRGYKLWWDARYTFADKKKTRIKDRYIWLLMFFASWGTQGNYRRVKELHKLYDEAILTAELDAALREGDRLYENFYSACDFFAGTLSEGKTILGLMKVKDKSPEAANQRIAAELTKTLLLPLGACCREKPHADMLVQALLTAAIDRYRGIRSHLVESIQAQADDDCRRYLLGILDRENEGLYGKSV